MTVDLNRLLAELKPDIPAGERSYLSVYTEERRYGGPEEGGWWYSWYSFEGSKTFPNRELAEQAREALQGWLEGRNDEEKYRQAVATANMPEGDSPYYDTEGYIPTGWSDGGKTILVVEDAPGAMAENQTVPHYE